MYVYQAVYILIVNLFLSADTQIQRKLGGAVGGVPGTSWEIVI